MLKKPLSFIAYLVVLAVLGIAVRHFVINPLKEKTEMSAAPFFTTTLINPNGVKANLEQYRGKIIVLNFWATWCPPCREEMPELSELQTVYNNKNVVVLGLAMDEMTAVKQFLQTAPVNYDILVAVDENMDLASQLGNNQAVLPYTVIIDTNGNVIATFFGRITKQLLGKSLQKLTAP